MQLCHMNLENVLDSEADKMMFALEKKRRREAIAAIREEYEQKHGNLSTNPKQKLLRPNLRYVFQESQAQEMIMSMSTIASRIPDSSLRMPEEQEVHRIIRSI